MSTLFQDLQKVIDDSQVKLLAKDKELVRRRNKSISESRKKNPLTNYDNYNKAMANRTEEWNQAIRDARQVQVIQQCDMDGKVIKEFPSYLVCQTQTGYSRSSIYKAVKGKKKRGNPNEAYGFLWFNKSK